MRSWEKLVKRGGLLVVLSGPSGVGKDAVLVELEEIHPEFRRCVTTTTRAPRKDEVDGVDYTFVSEDEFARRVDHGDFLEYANVHGNMYGTPRDWVVDRLEEGVDVVLKIDVQGGLAVKRQMPSALMIFLVPPSMEELERRLRGRLTDSDKDIAERLANAQLELEQIPHYDYLVVNDSLAKTAEDLRSILIAEHCRIQQ